MKLLIGGLGVVLCSVLGFCAAWGAEKPASALPPHQGQPVPMLHVSDLFRPHNDPDDHWDLACVYALAHQSRAELQGILIDYPQAGRNNDPDVLAVAQMNYLTGKAVPIAIGSPKRLDAQQTRLPENAADVAGVRAFLDLLRSSPRPVVISVLGSCRDVAIAAQLEPELFTKKCAAVYLNAGSGTPDQAKAARLEWNVNLDPVSYGAMFRLPCRVYWMPCFEEVPAKGEKWQAAQYGTFYRFRQGEILPRLSDRVQNFFAYMFRHGRTLGPKSPPVTQADWLKYLVGPKESDLLARQGQMDRNMWCTGGFLHAVGLTVNVDGQIVPLAGAQNPVYTFEPIRVECLPTGVTHWTPDAKSTDRFIFRVLDPERYPAAMATAMRSLLTTLP
jgi:hypothetical protein